MSMGKMRSCSMKIQMRYYVARKKTCLGWRYGFFFIFFDSSLLDVFCKHDSTTTNILIFKWAHDLNDFNFIFHSSFFHTLTQFCLLINQIVIKNAIIWHLLQTWSVNYSQYARATTFSKPITRLCHNWTLITVNTTATAALLLFFFYRARDKTFFLSDIASLSNETDWELTMPPGVYTRFSTFFPTFPGNRGNFKGKFQRSTLERAETIKKQLFTNKRNTKTISYNALEDDFKGFIFASKFSHRFIRVPFTPAFWRNFNPRAKTITWLFFFFTSRSSLFFLPIPLSCVLESFA